MKKIILLMVLAIILVGALIAQTLPVDSRKKEMQFHKSWEALRYSPTADTLWHKILIPSGTMEVIILADSASVAISPDSLYYKTAKPYGYLKEGIPLKLPTYKATKFYVRRAASGTSAHINIYFMKM